MSLENINRLLKRQLRRSIGGIENIPDHMIPLIESISRSYDHYEEDRILLERSMEISSEELQESNTLLRKDAEKQGEILTQLKDSLKTLQSLELGQGGIEINVDDDDDILNLTNYIQTQSNRIREVERELFLVKHLLDQSDDSFQVADKEGSFVFVNKECTRRMDYSRRQLLGMNVMDIEKVFATKADWHNHFDELKNMAPQSMIINGENVRKDGNSFPVEVNVKYVKVNGKEMVVAVSRDVTERAKEEKKRKKLIEQLKNVNDELKEFAYVVSHDLKAPLRGISTLSDWLILDYKEELDETGQSHLQLIKKRTGKMHELIEGILKYSKIGRERTLTTTINLKELIDDVVESLALPSHIKVEIDQQLPIIENEIVRMRQLFQNLIGNAYKYNDKTQGLIEVIAKDLENGYWEFCIKDNGPGIDEKYHDKIFKIFQTLDSKEVTDSTGVGLTIVKKIIRNNNGDIQVYSEKGAGASFVFTLPLVQQLDETVEV